MRWAWLRAMKLLTEIGRGGGNTDQHSDSGALVYQACFLSFFAGSGGGGLYAFRWFHLVFSRSFDVVSPRQPILST